MKWKEAEARLLSGYKASVCASESGSFSSLMRYFLSSVGCQTPMLPDAELTQEQADCIFGWMAQLQNGIPPQYAVGKVWFDSGEFFVGEGVLIPRSDTEHLVEFAARRLQPSALFYDLCCGSGCIGISVLKRRADLRCVAADIADAALNYAEKNAHHNGVADRYTTVKLDVCLPSPPSLERGELVIANPPYLTGQEMLSLPILLKKEPREALYGGEDGLLFYREILKNFQSVSPRFLFEIGCTQAAQVEKLAKEHGFEHIEIGRDYGGRDRIVYCEKKEI